MEVRYLKQLDGIESAVRSGIIPERSYVVDGRTLALGTFLHEARDDAPVRVGAVEAAITALRKPGATTPGGKPRDPTRAFVEPGKLARVGDHPASPAIFLAMTATALRRSEALPERVEVSGKVVSLADALAFLIPDSRSPAGEAGRLLHLAEGATVGAVASAMLEKLTDEGIIAKAGPAGGARAANMRSTMEAQQRFRALHAR